MSGGEPGDLHIDNNIDNNIDDNRDSETQLAAAVILIYDYEDYKICWSRSLGGLFPNIVKS